MVNIAAVNKCLVELIRSICQRAPLTMLGDLAARQSKLTCQHAFSPNAQHAFATRSVLHRHVHRRKLSRNRCSRPSTGICCQQTTVSDIEDVDPVTGEVVSAVKSKIPK